MRIFRVALIFLLGIACTGFFLADLDMSPPKQEWGFFGHRMINRMAVFTLPPEMICFYKANIEYITEHAVDPDKRRYAIKREGVRHYIDIDAWGDNPFFTVPRIFDDALAKYAFYYYIDGNDTISLDFYLDSDSVVISSPFKAYHFRTDSFRVIFSHYLMPQYYEDVWVLPADTLDLIFPGIVPKSKPLYIEDRFSKEGILPYHLQRQYYRLVQAFKENDKAKILKESVDFGHYIADAHVPLHTTKNYNGQLTNQVGIHAFWESRLPELFAEKEYSFLVGKAYKLFRPLHWSWEIVHQSHKLLDDVLDIEKRLRKEFPDDLQMCFDERLDRVVSIQCKEFSRAYHDRLNGMVESRMRDAILAVGSAWYSAWVDAGQIPLDDEIIPIKSEPIRPDPNVKPRSHETTMNR